MKQSEIKVGETYAVKVSGLEVPVKVESENENHKGRKCWTGTNTVTHRKVHIRSATKFRWVWGDKVAHLTYLVKRRGEPATNGKQELEREAQDLASPATVGGVL